MRIRRNLAAAITGATIATMAFSATALGATTVVVTDANAADRGWTAQHSHCVTGFTSTGSQIMEEGPENPPLGSGSREFTVGSDGNSFETFRLDEFNGTPLADLTELMYWTYVDVDGSGGQAPYINLLVDLTADGISDDQLFFEPVYQDGTYSGDTVPNQGPVLVDEWQDWDALNGGWWALSALTFGPPLVTIESYIAAHLGARLAMPASGLGSVRIAVGCGAGAWDNFVGNADAFSIGAGTDDSFTYDFELTLVPTEESQCKNGGWQAAVDEDGEPFRNQGQCLKFVRGADEGATIVVTPINEQGWSTADTRPGGTVEFVADADAPGGSGALELTTDATTAAKAQYLHEANTPLAEVAELSYWTKQVSGPPHADPSYQLILCLNGTATGCDGFTTLVFEPYQGGLPQAIATGVWQEWDVDEGLFWSTRTVTCTETGTIIAGTPGGPATYTLEAIQTACPDAIVAGFGVNIGSNNPSYIVRTDLFNINGTVYDFELSRGPHDACKDGGWQEDEFMNQGECIKEANAAE